jgi:hypothetical protein
MVTRAHAPRQVSALGGAGGLDDDSSGANNNGGAGGSGRVKLDSASIDWSSTGAISRGH